MSDVLAARDRLRSAAPRVLPQPGMFRIQLDQAQGSQTLGSASALVLRFTQNLGQLLLNQRAVLLNHEQCEMAFLCELAAKSIE